MRPPAWDALDRRELPAVTVGGTEVRPGARVRLRPADRRDITAAALDGTTGRVERIEQLVGGGVQLVVSADADPGRDLGGASPGHRFFFAPEEVEPLPRVLVAGIGNMFLGDDGFGCEVARRLALETLPAGVEVTDFGIRGFDLAYALASGYEAAVLIDVAPLDAPPGTVAVLEVPVPDGDAIEIDTHGMDPVRVLRLAMQLGGVPAQTLVVACRPSHGAGRDDPDDVQPGLSPPVRAAVDPAVAAVRTLLDELLDPSGGGDT